MATDVPRSAGCPSAGGSTWGRDPPVNPELCFVSWDNAISACSPIGGNYGDNELQMLTKLSPGEQGRKEIQAKNKPRVFCCSLGKMVQENGSCKKSKIDSDGSRSSTSALCASLWAPLLPSWLQSGSKNGDYKAPADAGSTAAPRCASPSCARGGSLLWCHWQRHRVESLHRTSC